MTLNLERRPFLFALAALPLTLVIGCEKKEDDVSMIRKLGLQAVAAAERHDVDGVMELVTPNYSASPGSYAEKEVRPILVFAFRRYRKFQILHPKFSISVEESGASASLSVPFFILKEGQTVDVSDLQGLEDDPVAWAKKITEKLGDPYFLEAALLKGEDGWRVNATSLVGFRTLRDL